MMKSPCHTPLVVIFLLAAIAWSSSTLAIAAAPTSAQPKHGEFGDETVKVGFATRRYRLVVPQTVDLSQPAPLVIAFHGMLIDSKDMMPKYTRLSQTAEQHRFVLVYPEAVGKSWGIKLDKVINDVRFFDALVAKLTKVYAIDTKRIYVLGMSNGGYFAHLLAKERSQTIAAVAAHSGPLGLQTLGGIHARRKFPVMIIHGDKDNIFPVSFARENRDKYEREGHEVKYVELPGLSHMWATQAGINETIWEFFASHALDKAK